MNTNNFEIGYAISSEEHHPSDIVQHARRAEELGFTFSLISDHFHPWLDVQGHSAFVWAVIGGIAEKTERIQLGTGVTCPLIRTHPAIIAQAAATVATMMEGRFFLGVGTGENLNEHILGDQWPAYAVRAEMLVEAMELMRLLWEGELVSYYGDYYTVENARIYTLPHIPPPIMVAAGGPESAALAGQWADGLISTSPDTEVVSIFEQHGSKHRPKYGKFTVCWAENEEEARQTAYRYWPTSALKGALNQELALPQHFEAAVEHVKAEDVAKIIICGNDPERYLKGIQKFVDAGYDHVYIHQIGPDQDGFFNFFEQHLAPSLPVREKM